MKETCVKKKIATNIFGKTLANTNVLSDSSLCRKGKFNNKLSTKYVAAIYSKSCK